MNNVMKPLVTCFAVIFVAVSAMECCGVNTDTDVNSDTGRISPIIEMTAITGSPDRAAVIELMSAYHEVGIDQMLIYPRSGLEIEYMSPQWLRLCRDCIETADSLGMKVWLYDEYNWPSGNCRGMVTADGHEDFYPNLLLFEKYDEGIYQGRVVRNCIGADILNPDAVARFITLTHQRYYDEFSEYFGNVIPGIFTDEPSFSYAVSRNGMLEADFTSFDQEHFAIAWYDSLEQEYRTSTGRSLRDDVILYLEGNASADLWRDYYTLMGERMRKTYLETISSWCEEHNIHLTGHLMYEKLYKSVRCNGNILKALSTFGIPGFDEANSDIDINALEMEISGLSVVQYAGRKGNGELAELYSVGPGDLTLSHQRQLMWMCAAYGVDHYLVAVSAFDARGNKEKGDWYYSSGPTQPWFDYCREFVDEASRAAEFARKQYDPQVRVRVPFSWFMELDKTPEFERSGLKYLRFLESLLKYQVQYLLLDEDEAVPENVPVLTYGPDGFGMEGDTLKFDDPDEYLRHVCRRVPRTVVVYDETGKEVRDVLVRRWADGSVILVDITDSDTADRILTVREGDRIVRVRMQGHGVFAGDFSVMSETLPQQIQETRLENVEVDIAGGNMLRCLYTEAERSYTFTVADSVKISFQGRCIPDSIDITLNGKPVAWEGECISLPYGFRRLYRTSGERVLLPGEYRVDLTGGGADYRFLPGLFLTGDFFAFGNVLFSSPRPGLDSRKCGLSGYAGTYELSADVEVPSGDGVLLRLDTHLACAEVLMDGMSLGRKGWGPYEWNVPQRMCGGTHRLTVRISTSIMPLFGDISLLEPEQPYVPWLRIKPGQHGDHTATGIFEVSFVKKIVPMN